MFYLLLIMGSILSIVMIVKFWLMTKDIKKIKNLVTPDLTKTKILLEIHKKNPDIENILFDALYMELKHCYYNDNDNKYQETIETYKRLYIKAGIPMPKIFSNIKNRSDFYETFIEY